MITIRIEGSILSSDIIDKIEQGNVSGQSADKFGFDSKVKVKDEIAKAWADAQDMWRIYRRQIEKLPSDASGTSETRKYWILPLLGLLGYDAELEKSSEVLDNKTYAISHRVQKLDGFPIHIMGFNDSLDKKRVQGGPRMSPHALVQEYLNLTEHLYAIVTNGLNLRLLRDSSRLIKLSFLEFDLYTMMEEGHFSDFAIMFRLLHSSRMPLKQGEGSESLIESYHQDALESGSRIREGLSKAVENSIISLGKGFLLNKNNQLLREKIDNNEITSLVYYQYILRLIYRLLFLMVIEERDLVFPKSKGDNYELSIMDYKLKENSPTIHNSSSIIHNSPKNNLSKRDIYYLYYSVEHLRKICEKKLLSDKKYNDLWISLKNNFSLFENENNGKHLGLKPLSGELFGYEAIGILNECDIDNKILLECLKNLSVFTNKKNNQQMRINYGALNVEEFGSVYEGLLEYSPVIVKEDGIYNFKFEKGTERSSSGSHYTPDELVQPLIKHSLDYIIEDKLKEKNPEQALLSIKVCDVACGSGHILLNAARRIATELAKLRTGEDQPSPDAFHKAVRDVIKNCIYGVDKNPLAVELCKVALWLEAHNAGEPLNFLDHHIKCGDAIVGLAHKEELENGIADEAFKKLPNDDGEVTKKYSRINREQRKKRERLKEYFANTYSNVDTFSKRFEDFQNLPENNIKEIVFKQKEYVKLFSSDEVNKVRILADIQVAQFFIPKTIENETRLVTDGEYLSYLSGNKINPYVSALSQAISAEKKFFHWFLEFPEVFVNGGFDCILGNPPYLGGKKITGNFGTDYFEYLKSNYNPAGGLSDYVTFFLRRIFGVIKEKGFLSIITTNTIAQGDTREGGLDVIIKNNGSINFAIKSKPWTGMAAVSVSLLSVFRGNWNKKYFLDNKEVISINPYLTNEEMTGNPYKLNLNKNKSFIGSYVLGDGFTLTEKEANELIESNPKNKEVIFPYLNGKDLNSNYDQLPSRWIINFFDWSEEKCKNEYPECMEIIEKRVKPERDKLGLKNDSSAKGYAKYWWQYARKGVELYKSIKSLKKVLSVAQTSKSLAFSFSDTGKVYSMMTIVFPLENENYFSILQSCFHNIWCWSYSSTMKGDLRYAPSDCFETFPFPLLNSKQKETSNPESIIHNPSFIINELEKIGEKYHDFRKNLMFKMKLGLTDTYNFFHKKDLKVDEIIKKSKQDLEVCKSAYNDIITLRELHKEMDNIVLKAYNWIDINLAHDFYEVDYLPENDRVRYTISPEARKEVLKRLLLLNHKIHEMEERGEKVNSILNSNDEIMNDELSIMNYELKKKEIKQQSFFDEPEQIVRNNAKLDKSNN